MREPAQPAVRPLRRGLVLAASALVLTTVAGGVAVARHVRVDLFDDYRAGYAAGRSSVGHDWQERCDAADRAAYPTQYRGPGPAGYPGTDEVIAFIAGCEDGALGRKSDPWHQLRPALGGGD